MKHGRSVKLGKVKKKTVEEWGSIDRLNKMLKEKDRKKRRKAMRDTRLKLNNMSGKSIGK